MKPSASARNFVPSSTAAASLSSGRDGTAVGAQIVQGHAPAAGTLMVMPSPGDSMLPLSSKARLLIETAPDPATVQGNDQEVVPVARYHDVPPSGDTSTPPITPPPDSVAVPLIVICVPAVYVCPLDGEVMMVVGAVKSADGAAGTKPACSVSGCAPMSANRLT